MNLSRSEQNQTEHALRKGNKAREERLSVAMGKEEAARVEHAQREAEKHRVTIESAITEAAHKAAVDLEIGMSEARSCEGWNAASGDNESGIAQERARCLAICAQWPDNLMACHLAKMIASGK